MTRGKRIAPALAAMMLAVAGCGGNSSSDDPVEQVSDKGGLRGQVAEAQKPSAGDFPTTDGLTLQELANKVGGAGPQLAMAGSVLTVGDNRFAFGMIDPSGAPVYGKSAIYVAPSPGAKAQGPFPAPADVLITAPAFRSKQAATEADPFAAIYAADVPFSKPGKWAAMAVTQTADGLAAAPGELKVVTKAKDDVPDIGEAAPKVETDTVASAKGDEESIDTRIPTAPDLHQDSFADVVGKKPVALLFATPQLCQSRVCGPVTDIELQMKAKYGKQMAFIHQEVYVDNDPNKGLRPPLKAFKLQTEPWLFVVDRNGDVSARLEGSFGVGAFEKAIKTAL